MNSNTPLQALDLLNDPVFVEAARVFAQNILSAAKSTEAQIDWAFLRAENRKPAAAERMVLAKLYRESLAQFRTDKSAAAGLIATGEAARPKDADEPKLPP